MPGLFAVIKLIIYMAVPLTPNLHSLRGYGWRAEQNHGFFISPAAVCLTRRSRLSAIPETEFSGSPLSKRQGILHVQYQN